MIDLYSFSLGVVVGILLLALVDWCAVKCWWGGWWF